MLMCKIEIKLKIREKWLKSCENEIDEKYRVSVTDAHKVNG